ncbi:MAG: hypothetical protein KIT00_10725 [Rhodospirillales bacterium]|nr:hypothetical protein [Rhodospirillales bacterium]
MLEVAREDRIVTLSLAGMVTENDFDAGVGKMDDILGPAASVRLRGRKGAFRLLLDWTVLDGWEKGAKALGTILGLNVQDIISKVAIVAEAKWHDEEARIADICKNATVLHSFFPWNARTP